MSNYTEKSEKFSNICSGIQSIAIAIGIILGGIWGYFEIDIFKKIDRAQAEVQKIKAEYEEIQKKINHVSLDLSLSVSQFTPYYNNIKGVEIRVEATNNGNVSIDFNMLNSPIILSKIEFTDERVQYATHCYTAYLFKYYNKDGNIRKDIVSYKYIRAGAKTIISFFIEVKEPGLYLAQFAVPMGKFEKKVLADLQRGQQNTTQQKIPVTWSTERFIFIR